MITGGTATETKKKKGIADGRDRKTANVNEDGQGMGINWKSTGT